MYSRVLVCLIACVLGTSATLWGQAKLAPIFEVASVRLSDPKGSGMTSVQWANSNRFVAMNASLTLLIEMAYGVDEYQLAGLPRWAESRQYDISAEAEGGALLTYDKLKPLLQNLLANRLHLVLHHETKSIKGYALVVASGGPKLKAGNGPNEQMYILANGLRGKSMSMDTFAHMLTHPLSRPVVDMTAITGTYDVNLDYAPVAVVSDAAESSLPSIFTAVVEQMGLKLQPENVSVDVLVFDSVSKAPTGN